MSNGGGPLRPTNLGFSICSIVAAAKLSTFWIDVHVLHSLHVYISGIQSGFYLPLFYEMSHDSVITPRYLSISEDEV